MEMTILYKAKVWAKGTNQSVNFFYFDNLDSAIDFTCLMRDIGLRYEDIKEVHTEAPHNFTIHRAMGSYDAAAVMAAMTLSGLTTTKNKDGSLKEVWAAEGQSGPPLTPPM